MKNAANPMIDESPASDADNATHSESFAQNSATLFFELAVERHCMEPPLVDMASEQMRKLENLARSRIVAIFRDATYTALHDATLPDLVRAEQIDAFDGAVNYINTAEMGNIHSEELKFLRVICALNETQLLSLSDLLTRIWSAINSFVTADLEAVLIGPNNLTTIEATNFQSVLNFVSKSVQSELSREEVRVLHNVVNVRGEKSTALQELLQYRKGHDLDDGDCPEHLEVMTRILRLSRGQLIALQNLLQIVWRDAEQGRAWMRYKTEILCKNASLAAAS